MKKFIIHFLTFFVISYALTVFTDKILTNKVKHFVYNEYSVGDRIISGEMDNNQLISRIYFFHYFSFVL